MPVFAEQLRALRAAANLTLREASARADVSPSALSDIERGRRCPSLEMLEQILAVYQMRLAIVPASAPDADIVPPGLRDGRLTAGEQERLAALLDDRLHVIALIVRLFEGPGAGMVQQLHQIQEALTQHRATTALLLQPPDVLPNGKLRT